MTIPPRRPLEKSNAHYARAMQRLPLGVASTFRTWGDDLTIYVHHGKGGRTWDIDGNGDCDRRLGYEPAILGHADDRVAWFPHDLGITLEPDSRSTWFLCEAHGLDETCLTGTLHAVELAVDLTLEYPKAAA